MARTRIGTIRRIRRKRGIRKRIQGTTQRPRLTVFRSAQNIYVQLIDDEKGATICSASSRDKDLRDKVGYGGNSAAAKLIGAAIAERATQKDVKEVCFDRNGYRYHGRLKALADAAREGGLSF